MKKCWKYGDYSREARTKMCATLQSCIDVSEYLLFQCNNSPFCARSPEMFKIKNPTFSEYDADCISTAPRCVRQLNRTTAKSDWRVEYFLVANEYFVSKFRSLFSTLLCRYFRERIQFSTNFRFSDRRVLWSLRGAGLTNLAAELPSHCFRENGCSHCPFFKLGKFAKLAIVGN